MKVMSSDFPIAPFLVAGVAQVVIASASLAIDGHALDAGPSYSRGQASRRPLFSALPEKLWVRIGALLNNSGGSLRPHQQRQFTQDFLTSFEKPTLLSPSGSFVVANDTCSRHVENAHEFQLRSEPTRRP